MTQPLDKVRESGSLRLTRFEFGGKSGEPRPKMPGASESDGYVVLIG